MADLSLENKLLINNLQNQLLEILNQAKKTEFLLLQHFGENSDTLISFEQLTDIF